MKIHEAIECVGQWADWLEELVRARADIERLTTERDDAVNCIYSVRTALENGDRRDAMNEIFTFEYKMGI